MARPTDRGTTDRRDVDVTDATTQRNGRGTTEGASATGHRERDHHVLTATGNGHAIAALVVGLLAATYAFFAVSAIAAVLFGLVAIGLGAKGLGIAKDNADLHKGLAISGIVSGALGLLLGIAVIAGAITLAEETGTEDLPQPVQDTLEEITD